MHRFQTALQRFGAPGLLSLILRVQKSLTEGPFRKLFKNTGLLLSGDTVSAVLGVFTFIVTARALGLEQLGMLVLIDAYVRIVEKLVNFQSWQFMIKYGSDALESGDRQGFKALVKFGTLVDTATALTGFGICLALAPLVGRWQGWSPEMIGFAQLYSLVVAFDIGGVPTGILRIFDRFKQFSIQKSVCATVKFAGALTAWKLGYGFKGFVLTWLVTEILDDVSLIAMAWIEMHKRGFYNIPAEPLKGITHRFKGLWGFLISTNLTGSIKVGFRELDILIVGKMLTLGDVSLYKMAKKICASLDRLTNPLYQSLYPELTRLWARRDMKNFKRIGRQMVLVMGALSLASWLFVVIWGKPLLNLTAGREFVASYSVTVWYMLANGIAITSLPLAPMILAMGRANLSFWIQFLPTLIYFPVLFWMIQRWGLNGAGYSYILYHGLRVMLQHAVVGHLLKATAHPPSDPLGRESLAETGP